MDNKAIKNLLIVSMAFNALYFAASFYFIVTMNNDLGWIRSDITHEVQNIVNNASVHCEY